MLAVLVVLAVALLAAGAVIIGQARRGPGPEVVREVCPVTYVDVPGPEVVREVCPLTYVDVPGPERIRPPRLDEVHVGHVAGEPAWGRPAEPVGFPVTGRAVADSEVDGGRLGPLVFRSVSVRGSDHRRQSELRRDAVLVHVLPAPLQAVLSVVAAGNPVGDRSHLLAAAACRGTVRALERLERSGSALSSAWRAHDRAELVSVLDQVLGFVADQIRSTARNQQPVVPEPDVGVELAGLLTTTGDRDEREHIAFGVGTGGVLLRGDGGFRTIFSAGCAATALPAGRDGLGVEEFTTLPGDTVVLATGAARAYLTSERGGEYFARVWTQPGDLAEFLWHASARFEHADADRSTVCQWDGGRVGAPTAPRPSS